MTMLEHCQQQDLCHLESRGGKPFISKTKYAFCVGKRRPGHGLRLPPTGTGAAHPPNRGA